MFSSQYRRAMHPLQRFSFLSCLVVLLACASWGQSATVRGVVKDPQSAVVVGATVSLANPAVSPELSAITDAHGAFVFSAVAAGNYDIAVTAPGFTAYHAKIAVAGMQPLTFDVTLALRAHKENVEVRGVPQRAVVSEAVSSLGPLTGGTTQQTPYSILVVPPEILENTQASTIDDVLKISPVAQISQPQTYGSQSLAMIRGFKVDNFQSLEDNLYTSNSLMNLEDKERIEILSGLSGFVYGATSPGGSINYVLKRPVLTPYYSLKAGAVSNSSTYGAADFGGPIYKDKITYRLNVAGQAGDTAVNYQSIERDLVSGALDYHIGKTALFSVDATHDDYRIDGTTAKWTFGTGVAFPTAPEATNLWAQKFGFSKENRNKFGSSLLWDANRWLTIRGRFSRETLTREGIQFTNTVTGSTGAYTEKATVWAPWMYTIKAGALAADARFKTGFLAHTVTAAWFGRNIDLREHQSRSASVNMTGTFTMSEPVYVTCTTCSVSSTPVKPSTRTENRNLSFADQILINKQWSAIVGLTYSDIITRGFSLTTGAITSRYDKSKPTPNASLMYTPISWLTAYATFTQGLEKGGTAGSTDTNANETMPPMLSKQYEAGVKAKVSQALVTLAFFNLNKAYEFDRVNDDTTTTYVQSGREIHRGMELTASGKLEKHLIVFGGLTLLDPQVQKNATASMNGKRPINVSKQLVKLYAEYEIPGFSALTVTGGVYHAGRMAADTSNLGYVPGYTTGDLGARYQFRIFNAPLIARYNVSNFTGQNYWLNNNYLGAPRAHSFTLEFRY